MTAKERQILVAEVIAPHGVNGAVSAESYSDNPRRFGVGERLLDDAGNTFTVRTASYHKGRLLLTFDEVPDRTAAEKVRHRKLYVAEATSPPLPEGSFYHYQLVGLTVQEAGRTIGVIEDVLPYSANDVYMIRTPNDADLPMPALRSIVQSVDLNTGIMEVRLPDGLLELAKPRKKD